jgi:hypothetical protein
MILTSLAVDAVCSVASEELKMEEWGVDVVLTATQKGLGVPPGLSVLVASPRAVETFKNRKAKATSYFANWKKWLPIMEAYEKGNAAYFATPPGLWCIPSLRPEHLPPLSQPHLRAPPLAHYHRRWPSVYRRPDQDALGSQPACAGGGG